VAQMVKSPPAIAGDLGLIPGLGISPGGRHDQYSCLENPPWTQSHGIVNCRTQLSK